MVGRSASEQRCLQCGIDVSVGGHMATVPYPSIHQAREKCPHGPFCARCGQRKENETLPQCECLALITDWTPSLPPQRARPRRSPAVASDAEMEAPRSDNGVTSSSTSSTSVAVPAAPVADVHAAISTSSPVETNEHDFMGAPLHSTSSGAYERIPKQEEPEPGEVIARAMAALDKLMTTMNVCTATESAISTPTTVVVDASRPLGAGSPSPISVSSPCPALVDVDSSSMGGIGCSVVSTKSCTTTSCAAAGNSCAPKTDNQLAEALKLRGGRPQRQRKEPASKPIWDRFRSLWN